MGLVSPGLRRDGPRARCRDHVAIGHCRYSTTGRLHLGERAADARRARRPARSRSAHNGNLTNTARASRPGRRAVRRGRVGRARPDGEHDGHRSDHRTASPGDADRHPRSDRLGGSPAAPGCVLPRLHGRDHPLRRHATLTGSGRWSSGGSTAAGWSPARRRPSTSSARPSCARSSRASSSPSTATACARSRFAEAAADAAASSSTCTSRGRTRRSADASSTPHGSRWGAGSPASTRSTPTSSSRSPSPGLRPPSVTRQESGIPFGQGLVKNAYVGRTFIQPSQTIRQLGIRLKLNPLREVIRGKRLVVVDDSIVRGQHPAGAGRGCSGRRGRPRSTSGSRRRRSPGRASTASTSRPGPS